jgi:ribonuclease VapC
LIVDTSALIAIIRDEEDAEAFASAIAGAPHAAISAANWFEASMVAEGRDPQRGGALFDATLAAARLEILPVTAAVAARARDAWRAYGKGRHAPTSISATASPMRSRWSAASRCCSRAMTSPRPM